MKVMSDFPGKESRYRGIFDMSTASEPLLYAPLRVPSPARLGQEGSANRPMKGQV